MTKQDIALRKLEDFLRSEFGEEAREAAEVLIRYVGLVVGIYQAIENDPERKALLDTLTKETEDSRMAEERSFTNQYEKP